MGVSGAADESPARNPFSPKAETALKFGLVLVFLYLFLVGVKGLEKGISAFGGDLVDQVFASVANPIAGLAAGVLATVLVQSSSVSTSTIVGLVGAGVLPVETAVPMVMGANIGTTVTNTLASLGHLRQSAYFQRAFTAATMHDYFNILTVILLLPLEIFFKVITRIATGIEVVVVGILPDITTGSSPIKTVIKAPVSALADLIEGSSIAGAEGWILLLSGVALIFVSLWMITRNMKQIMSGRMENAINAVLSKGAGAGALLVGLVMTVAVQSSSITTSILVPLVAAGVLTIRNAFPMTLGANVGTTVTALIASVASDSPEALAIALAHVSFNLVGILIFYPWPPLRYLPVRLAEYTADLAVRHKSLVAVYLIGVFLILPAAILFFF